MAVETRMVTQIGLYPNAPDRERAPCNARFARCARKNILAVAAAALVAGNIASHAQNASATQEQSAVAGAASAAEDLSDLGAMTFTCVKAGLNAAAREAAKAPTEGSYQFAYFKIISDGHHSPYEVDFKSNYMGEPDLKGPRLLFIANKDGTPKRRRLP